MKLTVIVPTYNRLDLLKLAVRSLLEQSSQVDMDILIVDDGSTDGTQSYAQELSEANEVVRVISQQNVGVTQARNAGLSNLLPTTELVTFLDSDDVSPIGCLSAQMAEFEKQKDLDLVYGRMLMVDEIDPQTLAPTANAKTLNFRAIQLSCSMMKRSLVEKVGFFDADLVQAEDTDYLLRVFETAPNLAETDVVCLYYRRHADNMTKRLEESRKCFVHALHKSIQRRRKNREIQIVKPNFDLEDLARADFF